MLPSCMIFVVVNGLFLEESAYVEYFEIVIERFARAHMPSCNLILKDILLSRGVVFEDCFCMYEFGRESLLLKERVVKINNVI